MFLRNVGWLSTDYTALYPRRWYSSCAAWSSSVCVSYALRREASLYSGRKISSFENKISSALSSISELKEYSSHFTKISTPALSSSGLRRNIQLEMFLSVGGYILPLSASPYNPWIYLPYYKASSPLLLSVIGTQVHLQNTYKNSDLYFSIFLLRSED
jgi:hypothetical protein